MRECEISVPEYSEKAVPEKARVWKTSGGIQYSLSEKGVLTIQGEGVLDDKNSSDTWWRERDTIFSGETGIKRARALWIHFRLKALKGGKIRALYDLDVYPDIITGEEVYSCMIRYSQNEDM